MSEQSPATDYTIVFVCVADFTHQVNSPGVLREVPPAAVDAVLRPAFVDSEVDWTRCTVTARGDRTLVLVPPDAPRLSLVDLLPKRLAEALRWYHEPAGAESAPRFRVLLHSGPAQGSAVDFASRVLDATVRASDAWQSEGVLDVALTDRLHQDVAERHADMDRALYRAVALSEDDVTTVWSRRPEAEDALLSWLDDLPSANPAVQRLMRWCAFLASQAVGIAWFSDAGVEVPTSAELGAELANGVERGLVTVDASADTVVVHPLARAGLRDRMTDEQRSEARRGAARLLARLDPHDPTSPRHWPRYRELLAHGTTPHVVESDDPAVRGLVVNLARYLYFRGDQRDAATLAQRAWDAWGPADEDDPQSLELASYRGLFLWALGRYEDAAEVNLQTLEMRRRVSGDSARETILARLRVAVDVRTSGDFAAARDQNVAIHAETGRLFAEDDPITLQTAHDLAVVTRLCGDYRSALDLDVTTWRRRDAVLGADNSDTLLTRSGVCMDRRELGEHDAALDEHLAIADLLRDLAGPEAPGTLLRQAYLAVALRRAGDHARALDLSYRTYEALSRVYGADHPGTLACSVGYATDLRRADRLEEAHVVGERTRSDYRRVLGENHPLALTADANAAVTLRVQGDPGTARKLNQQTLERMHGALGADHPHAIACAVNLASDAAALGDLDAAVRVGTETRDRAERTVDTLGPGHPTTLAARLNLILDRATQGADVEKRHAEVVDQFARTLGASHPATAAARTHVRADCDLDPLPL